MLHPARRIEVRRKNVASVIVLQWHYKIKYVNVK